VPLWFSVDIDTAAAVSLEDEGHRPRLYGGALTLNLGSVRNSPNPGADGWANALDAEWTNVASENSPSGSSGAGDVRQAASDPRGPDAAVLRSAAEAGAEGARAEGLNPASLKAYGGWRVPAAEITLAQAIQDPAALSVTPVAVAENLSGATVAAGGAGVTLVSDPSGLFEIGPDGAALKLKADRFLDVEAPSRSYTVTLSADDGQGGTVRKTVTFTASVTDANEAPRAAATGNRAEGGQNKILFGTLPAGSDEDGGELTYELVAPVPSLTLLSTGAFSYEPQADFNGEVRFDYVAVDPGGARSEPQTFVLAVVRAAELRPTPRPAATRGSAEGRRRWRWGPPAPSLPKSTRLSAFRSSTKARTSHRSRPPRCFRRPSILPASARKRCRDLRAWAARPPRSWRTRKTPRSRVAQTVRRWPRRATNT
jgi:hypothetical protein